MDLQRTDFVALDLTRGTATCEDAITIRSSEPDLLASTSSAVRLRRDLNTELRSHELFPPPSAASAAIASARERVRAVIQSTYGFDVGAGLPPDSAYTIDDINAKAGLSPATLSPALGFVVTHLHPFPAPFSHVVLWVGWYPPRRLSVIGVYDTDARRELLANNPLPEDDDADDRDAYLAKARAVGVQIPGQLRWLEWLITPTAPDGAICLTLFATTESGKLHAVTAKGVALPAVTPTRIAARSASDATVSDAVSAWCAAAASQRVRGLKVSSNSPQTMYQHDGTARVVYGAVDNELTIVTPAYDSESDAVTATARSASRTVGLRDRKLPIEDIAVLDGDRIAVLSASRIRIWDLSVSEEDGTHPNVELVRPASSRTKKIIHFLTF